MRTSFLVKYLVYSEGVVTLEVADRRDVGDFFTIHVVELHGDEVAVVRHAQVQTEERTVAAHHFGQWVKFILQVVVLAFDEVLEQAGILLGIVVGVTLDLARCRLIDYVMDETEQMLTAPTKFRDCMGEAG